MEKNFLEPQEVCDYAIGKGEVKANASLTYMLSLGFLAGAFICLGYLAYIRVAGAMPEQLHGLGSLLGAMVFPVGLICILVGGGELVTGNMMGTGFALFAKKISFKLFAKNMVVVTLANLAGGLFVAYFFGHVVGLTEGEVLHKTISVAKSKVDASFVQAFVSAIGCNWLVGMGLWLCYAAKDVTGKILGTWFPVMTFVAIGFQHVVANMFIIPAAMFSGESTITLTDFIVNIATVFAGNLVGGMGMVSGMYYIAYKK